MIKKTIKNNKKIFLITIYTLDWIKSLKNIYFNIKYFLLSFSTNQGVNSKSNIIISTTTTPNRLKGINLMIESIMRQEYKPKKIILWISNNITEKNIPKKIIKYKKRGLDIQFCKDLGPHTKFYYAIKKYHNNHIVVTADSDMIYSKEWLTNFVNNHKKYPKDILCYEAGLIKKIKNKLDKYNNWKNTKDIIKTNKTDSWNIFPKSSSGMFYPIKIFNKEILDKKFLILTEKNDDIWIKAISLLSKIKCRLIKKPKYIRSIFGSQTHSLYKINVLQNYNDIQMKQVFDEYNLYKYIK